MLLEQTLPASGALDAVLAAVDDAIVDSSAHPVAVTFPARALAAVVRAYCRTPEGPQLVLSAIGEAVSRDSAAGHLDHPCSSRTWAALALADHLQSLAGPRLYAAAE